MCTIIHLMYDLSSYLIVLKHRLNKVSAIKAFKSFKVIIAIKANKAIKVIQAFKDTQPLESPKPLKPLQLFQIFYLAFTIKPTNTAIASALFYRLVLFHMLSVIFVIPVFFGGVGGGGTKHPIFFRVTSTFEWLN